MKNNEGLRPFDLAVDDDLKDMLSYEPLTPTE